MVNRKLAGKKILITGASGGIGMFLAIHVARAGGTPILVARSVGKLQIVSHKIEESFQVSCYYYKADLQDGVETKSVLDQIYFDHGSVDAVINNAGVAIFSYVAEAEWQDIEQMIDLNVTSLIRTTHQLLPHFIKQNHGHIINIASQAGKMATPKSAVYSASKHAVIGFTNALRMEVEKRGIFVTAVNLGPVRTNFFQKADPTGSYQKSVDSLMLHPNKVAYVIVQSLFTKCREINSPAWMNAGSRLYQIAPTLMERVLEKQFNKK
ncbi:SDR family NAD(P)-dependent oxidoreductase [Halobacillus seohaensis]|uniref:SDR family NAD(P)-dependent oxidoreductase n=1 Tax=Halobacillus seohaensis TaxID=447421 RepID=A0ABW2EH30_9BACI